MENIEKWHIASCSFGKDSLAMILRMKELQSKIDRPMKKFQNKQYGFYGNVFDMEKVFEQLKGGANG